MAAAAAAEVQTELAALVAAWRAKMDPALAQQDARGDFDIHQCASLKYREKSPPSTPAAARLKAL